MMHLKMMMKWYSSLNCKLTSLYIDYISRFCSKIGVSLHKVCVKQRMFTCLCLTDQLTHTHLEQLCVLIYAVYHHSETCMLLVTLKTMSTYMINMEPSQKVYSVQTGTNCFNTTCRANIVAVVFALLHIFLPSFPRLHIIYP